MTKLKPPISKHGYHLGDTAKLLQEEMNDPILATNKGIGMAICVECEYYKADYNCMNDDLPISDFVEGSRDCYENNPHGNCKGFKAKSKPQTVPKRRPPAWTMEEFTKNPGT